MPNQSMVVKAEHILMGDLNEKLSDYEWQNEMLNLWRDIDGSLNQEMKDSGLFDDEPDSINFYKDGLVQDLKTYLESLGYDLE